MTTSLLVPGLGTLIDGYGFRYSQGDNLQISEHGAALPVHPSWIFALGLLGRYSNRDQKYIMLPVKRHRAPTPGVPRLFERPQLIAIKSFDSVRQFHDWETSSPLCGNTGIIASNEEYWTFRTHPRERIGSISEDTLSLRELLWLVLGSIPSGNSVYSLSDVEMNPEASQLLHSMIPDSDDSEDDWSRVAAKSLTISSSTVISPKTSRKHVNWDDEDSDSDTPAVGQAQGRFRGCEFKELSQSDDSLIEVFRPFGGYTETILGSKRF